MTMVPKFIYGYGHMVLKRRLVYGDMVPMVPRFGYGNMVTKVRQWIWPHRYKVKVRIGYGDMVPKLSFGYGNMVTKVSYGYGQNVPK